MRRLVENDELRLKMSDAVNAAAEERTIEKNIGLWEKAYGLT